MVFGDVCHELDADMCVCVCVCVCKISLHKYDKVYKIYYEQLQPVNFMY